MDDWKAVERNYSKESKHLITYAHTKYPKNKELYFAVSTFYDNNYNFTNRTSFAEMKANPSKNLKQANCDEKLTNEIMQRFESLVKEGDKK